MIVSIDYPYRSKLPETRTQKKVYLCFWVMSHKCPGKWFLEEPCWIPVWISLHCVATNLLCWLYPICRALHSKHWERLYWQVHGIISKDYFIVRLSKAVWLIWALGKCPPFQWHKTSRPTLIVSLLTRAFLCINSLSSYLPFSGFSVWIPLF